ncbi:lipid II flippase MurJ [Streptomyces violaceus]|uniref:lipid II flippase MurJ n=1 Tax=Streptomyces violaceus TaxID=1936 RepID=UPI0031E8F0A4
MFLLGEGWGVRSAAVGVAAGGCLMVAVQVPSLWRRLTSRTPSFAKAGAVVEERPMQVALVAAVLLFRAVPPVAGARRTLPRLRSARRPISHLNYAQKVAQIPMTLSLMVCTVTFPLVARALADGDIARARSRVERDLALAACLVLMGMCAVIACAPQMIELLFQRARSPRATPRRRRTSCASTPSDC